jgi:hypothetical protein
VVVTDSRFLVFVIWAGRSAHAYALALQNLLERCLVSPVFVSSVSITPGRASYDETVRALREARQGFACLTSESALHRDWPHFELGALVGRDVPVAPILFENAPAAEFSSLFGTRQAVRWTDKERVYGIVQDLNTSMGLLRRRSIVKDNFEPAYQGFGERYQQELQRLHAADVHAVHIEAKMLAEANRLLANAALAADNKSVVAQTVLMAYQAFAKDGTEKRLAALRSLVLL